MKNSMLNKAIINSASVLFWVFIWYLVSKTVNLELILPSPFAVLNSFVKLLTRPDFWISVIMSLTKIVSGFLLGVLAGLILGYFAARSEGVYYFFNPVVSVIKATPVASFTILALLWVDSRNLSLFISFLMVLPIIFYNVKNGLCSVDYKILEMAKIFEVSFIKKLRYIYFPHLLPFLRSACAVALGFAWKSGIAAEVIGISRNSIGENLLNAKINLETADLFAWTAVIILLSFSLEKLFLRLLKS